MKTILALLFAGAVLAQMNQAGAQVMSQKAGDKVFEDGLKIAAEYYPAINDPDSKLSKCADEIVTEVEKSSQDIFRNPYSAFLIVDRAAKQAGVKPIKDSTEIVAKTQRLFAAYAEARQQAHAAKVQAPAEAPTEPLYADGGIGEYVSYYLREAGPERHTAFGRDGSTLRQGRFSGKRKGEAQNILTQEWNAMTQDKRNRWLSQYGSKATAPTDPASTATRKQQEIIALQIAQSNALAQKQQQDAENRQVMDMRRNDQPVTGTISNDGRTLHVDFEGDYRIRHIGNHFTIER